MPYTTKQVKIPCLPTVSKLLLNRPQVFIYQIFIFWFYLLKCDVILHLLFRYLIPEKTSISIALTIWIFTPKTKLLL